MDRDSDSGAEDESSSVVSAYPTEARSDDSEEEDYAMEEEKPDVKVDPCLICAQPAVFYSVNGNPIKREIPLEADYTYQQLFSDFCYCLKISRNEDFLQHPNDAFPFCDDCEVLLVKLSELNMKLKEMEMAFRKKIIHAEGMYLKDGLYEKSDQRYFNFRKQISDLLLYDIQQKKVQKVPMCILRSARKASETSKTMVDLIPNTFLPSSNAPSLPPSLPASPFHTNANDDDAEGNIDVYQKTIKIDPTRVAGVSKHKLKKYLSTSGLKKRRNEKVKPRLKQPKLDISSHTTREKTTDTENNDNIKITRSRSHHKRKSLKTVVKKNPRIPSLIIEKNGDMEKCTFTSKRNSSHIGHSLTKDLRTGNIKYESGFGNRYGSKRHTLGFEKVEDEDNLKCSSCSRIVRKETNNSKQASVFRKHLLDFHAGYRQCTLCRKNFEDVQELLCHLKDSHNLHSVQAMRNRFYYGKDFFKGCDICGKPFNSCRGSEYFHHRMSHLSEEEKMQDRRCRRRGGWWRPTITDSVVDERYSMCEVCGELISRGGLAMEQHLKTHLPEDERKTFLCSICGQKYVTKNLLEKHMSSVHSGGKCGGSNSCRYSSCKQGFKSEEALKEHVTLEHATSQEAKGKLMCVLCGKVFTSTWARHQHRLVHSGEKNHECPVCDRKFPLKNSLLTHLAGVHSQGELYGQFKCDFLNCGFVFPYEKSMRTHMRLKHGVFSRQVKGIVGHGTVTACDDAQ